MQPEPSRTPLEQEQANLITHRFTLNGHQDGIRKLTWSRDGQRLASAGDDCRVCIWDTINNTQLHEVKHRDRIATLAWSDDGRFIASGGHDGRVRICDSHTGEELRILVGHAGPVRSIAFDPFGKYLATASADTSIRLWEIDSGWCSTNGGGSTYYTTASPSPRTASMWR